MKINIYPSSEEFGGEYMRRCIAPANQDVPKWYKESQSYVGNISDTKFLHKRMTIKKCIPVLDYMTNGLNLYLPFSIHVEGTYPERVIESSTPSDSEGKLSNHHVDQVQKFPLPDIFDPHPLKVDFPYTIETPRGYSSVYVQPVNELYENILFPRGLVNTDNYHNQVNFPFFVRKDFSGTIEAGTHFMSVFFIKREKLEVDYKSYEDGASRLAQTRAMVINWSKHFYRNNRFNRQ